MATEDTYGGGGEDEVRGRREDGVEEVAAAKRFVSGVDASSGGARVCARWLGGRRDCDRGELCIYKERDYTA